MLLHLGSVESEIKRALLSAPGFDRSVWARVGDEVPDYLGCGGSRRGLMSTPGGEAAGAAIITTAPGAS